MVAQWKAADRLKVANAEGERRLAASRGKDANADTAGGATERLVQRDGATTTFGDGDVVAAAKDDTDVDMLKQEVGLEEEDEQGDEEEGGEDGDGSWGRDTASADISAKRERDDDDQPIVGTTGRSKKNPKPQVLP